MTSLKRRVLKLDEAWQSCSFRYASFLQPFSFLFIFYYIQEATSIEKVKKIYLDYAMDISFRARANLGKNPLDKSFEQIAIACAEVMQLQ